MNVETVVAIVLSVVAGAFGREFFGKYLLARQNAEQERETSVIDALVNLTQSSSQAQIQLTSDALATLREMAENLNSLTGALTRHEETSVDRLGRIDVATVGMTDRLERLDMLFAKWAVEIDERIVTLVRIVTHTSPEEARFMLEKFRNKEAVSREN